MRRTGLRLYPLMILLLLCLLRPAYADPDVQNDCKHQWKLIGEQAATCTEDGSRQYRCALCGAKKTETVAATGHDWGMCMVVQTPTCTERGITRCICTHDETHILEKYTDPLGHDWSAWKTVRRATTDEPGVEQHVCKRCDATEQRQIPARIQREAFSLTAVAFPIEASGLSEDRPTEAEAQDASVPCAAVLINTGKQDLIVREYAENGEVRALKGTVFLPAGYAIRVSFEMTASVEATENGPDGLPMIRSTFIFFGLDAAGRRVCAADAGSFTVPVVADGGQAGTELNVTQTLLSMPADPTGFRAGETVYVRVSVANSSDRVMDAVILESSGAEEKVVLNDLQPGETRSTVRTACVTTDDAIAGRICFKQSVGEQPADGAPGAHAASDTICMPVNAKTGLISEIRTVDDPAKGSTDGLTFRICVKNTSNRPFYDVAVYDPTARTAEAAQTIARFDRLLPEEEQTVTFEYRPTAREMLTGCVICTSRISGAAAAAEPQSFAGPTVRFLLAPDAEDCGENSGWLANLFLSAANGIPA